MLDGRFEKGGWKVLGIALVVAIIVHLQLLLSDVLPGMYRFWSDLFPKAKVDEATEVTLIALTPKEFEANRRTLPKLKAKKQELPQEEKEKQKESERNGQIVDLAPSADNTPPEKSDFLSEHNTRVEKQTVSRNRTYDYGVVQSKPTVAQEYQTKRTEQQEKTGNDKVAVYTKKRGDQQASQQQNSFAFEIPDVQKRDSLNLKLDLNMGELARYRSSEEIRGNSDKLRIQKGKKSQAKNTQAGEQGEHDQTLAFFQKPSLDKLDMVTGAPANDDIQDVPEGEETLLNSREFKYATFFNRVKRGVSQYWAPRVGEEYIHRDPYGNIYGVKDRHTMLSISLDPTGKLRDISVVSSCGVDFFDDVAIQSFRDASPFPNPPSALVDNDGHINFLFGFRFVIGERPILRGMQFQQRPF